jgi:hypothetical protein
MRRKLRGAGMLFVLVLVAPAMIAAFSPLDAMARPPAPVPGPPGGLDPVGGSADPDALGTDAPSLPPIGPGADKALEWGVTPERSGLERVVHGFLGEWGAVGVVEILMHI